MTDTSLTLESVLSACSGLIGNGACLMWLQPRRKNPRKAEWSSQPRPDLDALRRSYLPESNVGIRLGQPSATPFGFIHIIDLDVRNADLADEARKALSDLFPQWETFPSVISGSGGHSRHIWFVTDKPFSKRKLAKSDGYSMVFDPSKNRDVKKNHWEIDLLGTGSYAVIPPSIHPDTGLAYVWERPFDFFSLEMGIFDAISSETVEKWGAKVVSDENPFDDDEDDLIRELRTAPVDISDEEVEKAVQDLPENWVEDRDTWVTLGSALHHQYQGGQKGFDLWCEWSKQSAKYDPKTQKSVWKSFKGDLRPVTFRTVLQAANEARLQRNLPAVVADSAYDDELMSLLGAAAPPDIAPKAPEIDENWTSYLTRNDDGQPTSTLHNIKLVLQNDVRCHGILALNEFTSEAVLINEPKRVSKKRDSAKPVLNLDSEIWRVYDPVNGHLWTDSHDQGLRLVVEAPKGQGGYGFKVTDRDMKAAVDIVANNMRFHPVRAYLQSLEWDGQSRADQLFVDFLGCDDTPYHREAARLILVGAVARVMEPGHKFDFVPILEGLQGKRKSTFISILGRSMWFAELSGDFHNRQQMVEQIQGAWIIEIPELQGFSRADTNVLKGFISATFDKVRMAYARRAQIFQRQCVFLGSTNDDEYLRDHTGGRRFWPIKCQLPDDVDIDTDRLESVIDQVWAEAYQIYVEMRRTCKKRNLPLYLQHDDAKREAKELQESRRVETVADTLSGQIEAWLNEPTGPAEGSDDLDPNAPQSLRNVTCVADVWIGMMGRKIGELDQASAVKIGTALGRVPGWHRHSDSQVRTKKYGRQKLYVRDGYSLNVNDILDM